MPRFIVFKVTRALIARFLFACHSIVAIWILYAESRQLAYWAFAASPILLFIEGMVTIVLRHGDEYKWFCPSVFIFLCGSVPPIWFLELRTTWRAVNNVTPAPDSSIVVDMKWIGYIMFELPQLPYQMWFQVVEQSLLVILILGRWLLPKGRISRDDLSQLLLAYLAISADIVELFNLFQEREVRMNLRLSIIVLSFWSVSLIQFPFVITTVKSQKARYCFVTTPTHEASPIPSMTDQKTISSEINDMQSWSRAKVIWHKICDVRVWGIMSTILLQDLPFWVLRIYLIFWENIMSYTMFFFICKNSLIMCIQLYRLIIICGEQRQTGGVIKERSQTPPKQSSLLHAEYYSPFYNLENVHRVENGKTKKTKKKQVVAPVVHEDTQQQNGSVRGLNLVVPVAEDGDRRQSTFNITGTINAKDLMARNKKPTGRIGKKKTKVENMNEKKDSSAKAPTIRLASIDTIDDL